jgi:Rps23 Pro-64 3,4-dihydroxylase Tpa1-like proline 4-hydroxylase
MSEIIDGNVLSRTDELRRDYSATKPFKYVVIDDFLDKDFADELLREFPKFDAGNSVGDDGKPGLKATFEHVSKLGKAYQRLDGAIQQREFLTIIEKITGIQDLLYDPFYLGGGTHENRSGQSLQAHVDFNYHPSEGWHRRLNLIVYLNREWEPAWGGNLELFRDPYVDTQPEHRITPKFNRCVIFETTEKSWHGFDEIRLPQEFSTLSRKSVALYFYSKERPTEEIAGRHTTHYVNRQLPDSFVAGRILNDDDVALLRNIVQTRDDLLRRLYSENADLRQAQERGVAGKIISLMRRAYIRFRR